MGYVMTLRERMLNRKFKQKELKIDFGEGPETVVVRQPSVEQRSQIFEAAGVVKGEKLNIAKLQATAVIACTFDANGNAVFKPEDEAALREGPADDSVDELVNVVTEFLNVSEADAAKK